MWRRLRSAAPDCHCHLPVVGVDEVGPHSGVPGVGVVTDREEVGQPSAGLPQPGHLGEGGGPAAPGLPPTVLSCFRNTRQSRLVEEPSDTDTTLLFTPSKAAENTPCLKQSQSHMNPH